MPLLVHLIVWGFFFIIGLVVGLMLGIGSVIPNSGKRL